ncbi:hypothetical protein D3C72_2237460 [compost metagenome]
MHDAFHRELLVIHNQHLIHGYSPSVYSSGSINLTRKPVGSTRLNPMDALSRYRIAIRFFTFQMPMCRSSEAG